MIKNLLLTLGLLVALPFSIFAATDAVTVDHTTHIGSGAYSLPNANVGTATTAASANLFLGYGPNRFLTTNGVSTNTTSGSSYRMLINQDIPLSAPAYVPFQFWYDYPTIGGDNFLSWRVNADGSTNEFHMGYDTVDVTPNPAYVFAAYRYFFGGNWAVADKVALFLPPGPIAGHISYGNRIESTFDHTFVGSTTNHSGIMEIQQTSDKPGLDIWNSDTGSNWTQVILGKGSDYFARFTIDPDKTDARVFQMSVVDAVSQNTQRIFRVVGTWNNSAIQGLSFLNLNDSIGTILNPGTVTGTVGSQLAINNTGSADSSANLLVGSPIAAKLTIVSTNAAKVAQLQWQSGTRKVLLTLDTQNGDTYGAPTGSVFQSGTSGFIPFAIYDNGRMAMGGRVGNSAPLPFGTNTLSIYGSEWASNMNVQTTITLNGWTNYVENGTLVWTNGAGGWMKLTAEGTLSTSGNIGL